MQKTEHYQLNQWEAEDSVKRTDFNEDNAKIDAAIKAVEQTSAEAVVAAKEQAANALSAYQASNDAALAAEVSARKSAVSNEASARASAITAAKQEAANALSAYKTTNNAAVAALQSALDTKPFVIGSYTGNNVANRTITVGFTPRFLIQLGYVGSNIPIVSFVSSEQCCYITPSSVSSNGNTVIVNNGFETARTNSYLHNASDCKETYIAFR